MRRPRPSCGLGDASGGQRARALESREIFGGALSDLRQRKAAGHCAVVSNRDSAPEHGAIREAPHRPEQTTGRGNHGLRARLRCCLRSQGSQRRQDQSSPSFFAAVGCASTTRSCRPGSIPLIRLNGVAPMVARERCPTKNTANPMTMQKCAATRNERGAMPDETLSGSRTR